jgi:hypothetical protein
LANTFSAVIIATLLSDFPSSMSMPDATETISGKGLREERRGVVKRDAGIDPSLIFLGGESIGCLLLAERLGVGAGVKVAIVTVKQTRTKGSTMLLRL